MFSNYNGRIDGTDAKSIIKNQDTDLVNTEDLKYLSVLIGYNKFITGHKN